MKTCTLLVFKPKMSGKLHHIYRYFPLQAKDMSFGARDRAEPGPLRPQRQALWPLPGSTLPPDTSQSPTRMHPIYLCPSTSKDTRSPLSPPSLRVLEVSGVCFHGQLTP